MTALDRVVFDLNGTLFVQELGQFIHPRHWCARLL